MDVSSDAIIYYKTHSRSSFRIKLSQKREEKISNFCLLESLILGAKNIIYFNSEGNLKENSVITKIRNSNSDASEKSDSSLRARIVNNTHPDGPAIKLN
jgi:hypothetical protein